MTKVDRSAGLVTAVSAAKELIEGQVLTDTGTTRKQHVVTLSMKELQEFAELIVSTGLEDARELRQIQ